MTTVQRHNEHALANRYAAFDYIEHEIRGPEIVNRSTLEPENRRIGTVGIEICNECGIAISTCLHTDNSWNDEGTQLTCDLCGEDGT